MKLWQVAVNAPIKGLLTYQSTQEDDFTIGQSVIVPLGKRKIEGVIIESIEFFDGVLKNIISKHPERPLLTQQELKWAQWLSKYYIFPLGMTLESFFPPLKKHGRIKKIEEKFFDPLATDLNTEQKIIFDKINASTGFNTHFIHGITGSGKTEIYIKLIEEVIQNDKQVVFLLPEISLTPQLVNRFLERLGNIVSVIHSDLTEREKTLHWWSMIDKTKKVLIGARSALFCPIPNLGMIILDEEHETSFKQDEKLRYHARDAAIVKAQIYNIPVVMGSATPSLETWHNANTGKYKLYKLNKRHGGSELPDVQIVDLEKSIQENKNTSRSLPYWLSSELHAALEKTYTNKLQAALFLNRRGISPLVQCLGCGFNHVCPNCDITLTLHGDSYLNCHYCGYEHKKEVLCPDCNEFELKPVGIGTEQIERDLQELFPLSKIVRIDRDEVTHRDDLVEKIKQIESFEVDFIIGTQMIAKGLDFPKLNLVGVIQADISLNIPDFRSSERTFQILTQVAGRAGRRQLKGQVIIQTYRPEHESIVMSAKQDYEAFSNFELQNRQDLNYPPFSHLAVIRVQNINRQKAQQASQKIKHLIESWARDKEALTILGPTPSRLARLKNKYRFQILIKSKKREILNQLLSGVSKFSSKDFEGAEISLDVDPQTLI